MFLLPLAILVIVWAAVRARFGLGDDVIASPPQVLRAAWELVGTGVLPSFISVSMGRLAVGALLACAVGVPIGLLLGLARYGAAMFEPFLRFMQAVSGIAWLPLAIIWFGFTNQTIFAIIVYTAFIPVVFNTMTGVRTVPPIYRQAMATMGAGPLRIMWSVYLPGALPSIVVGVRLGIGYGWRALIAGEMLAGATAPQDVVVTLSFRPEVFHVRELSRYGVFGGTPEGDRKVTLLQVPPPNLRALSQLYWIRSIDPAR
jgi:taurine transport system permease protein